MTFFNFDNHTTSCLTNYDTDTLDNHTTDSSVTAVTVETEEVEAKPVKKSIIEGIKKMKKEAKEFARAETKALKDAKQAAAKAEKAAARAQAKADKEAAKVAAKEEAERINLATRQRFSTFFATGEALAKQHEGYETQYVTKANADLYVLLTSIHEYAIEVMADAEVDAIIKEMREELRWKYKIRTQKNSPALNIIVRYVTRTNRKNASVYARVIRTAMADGITSAGLTAYIVDARGIDKIREAVVKKPIEITDVKKAETIWKYAESYLEAHIAIPMASFELSTKHSAYMADTVRGGRFTYFVCDHVGGKYQVVDALLMDKALEQQLLERVFSNAVKDQTRTKEEVALFNKIEAELGLSRKVPLVANAYEGE